MTGIIILVSADSSLVRHFVAPSGGLYEASDAVLTPFCCLSPAPAKSNQNNIRSPHGTPLDSGRFRQAPRDLERNDVLTSIVVSIVRFCTRFAIPIVILSLILAIGAGFYTARNFAINTDINTLISPDLDWRKRDNKFEEAFDRERLILAVIEAPTPELTSA